MKKKVLVMMKGDTISLVEARDKGDGGEFS